MKENSIVSLLNPALLLEEMLVPYTKEIYNTAYHGPTVGIMVSSELRKALLLSFIITVLILSASYAFVFLS